MIWSSTWMTHPLINAISRLKGGGNCAPRLDQFEFINFSKIPSYGVTHNILECCIERADDIKKMDIDVMVLFSGGMDCTLAAITMIHVGMAGRMTIGMSKTAWKFTDPMLIDYFVDNGCTIKDINGKSIKDYVDNGGHFITGCQGDTILNSDYIHSFDIINDLWEVDVETMFRRTSGLVHVAPLIDSCKPFFDAMPSNIEQNAPNMIWWLEFCGDWHVNNFNVTSRANLGAPGITHTHFFDSTPFQRWSMQDYTKKIGKTSQTHKQAYYSVCCELSGCAFKIPIKTFGCEDIFRDNYDPTRHSRLLAIKDDWKFILCTR